MSDKPVIGFIGLGLMGRGMAKNIREAGYELWVRGRRDRAPVERLLALGAHEAESPRDMAERCDIIHLCLPNSASVGSQSGSRVSAAAMKRPTALIAASNVRSSSISSTYSEMRRS